MVEKTKIIDDEIEIGTSKDIIDRIKEHWFDELNVSSDDYIYIKTSTGWKRAVLSTW